MNILLLGGNSKLNKEWVESVAANVGSRFDSAVVQEFEHWKSDDENASVDWDLESKRQEELVKDWSDYIVFAKSAGAVITLKNVHEGKISPSKLVFVGFPYEWGKQEGLDIDLYIKNLKVPVLFIQKPNDWAGKYEDLVALLERSLSSDVEYMVVRYEREGEPDNDHHYADIQYINSLMSRFADTNFTNED